MTLIVATVWTGGIPRCKAISAEGPIQCDLIHHHDGPHFYVLDHDDEGSPRLIGTFTDPPWMVNYDGPDPSVECAFPLCTNRLRCSDEGGDQWCSIEHREATPAARSDR